MQGVAAAAYHLMLSAHLRGYAAVWNAGTGDPAAVRRLLKLPAIFESQGAIAIGHAAPDAPKRKPPRRPLASVMSYQEFARDPATIYPARPADSYPFASISRADNPYAVWDPAGWNWDQVADYRAWSVWAKSPLAGVYTSHRQGDATARELDMLPDLPADARVLDVMPWAGTNTVALARRLPDDAHLTVAELHAHNLTFIADRLTYEAVTRPVDLVRMTAPALPLADASMDAVVIAQALEHMPDPAALLAEVRRVLKPDGRLVISARNRTSRYGAIWAAQESRGQVPLQGPFTPLRPRVLLDLIGRDFTIERLAGIGLNAAEDSDTADQGLWRMRRRVIAVQARPR